MPPGINTSRSVAALWGAEGGVSGLHAWCMTGDRVPCYAHAIYTATATEQHTVCRSKAGYEDFFVTQGREKSTDSVEGAAAQESIDSVK